MDNRWDTCDNITSYGNTAVLRTQSDKKKGQQYTTCDNITSYGNTAVLRTQSDKKKGQQYTTVLVNIYGISH
jgi:hypothetical protein